MPELAYLNGSFCAIADAKVSIEDRGFQFGDGVYEVIFAYGGRVFEMDAHMQRLRRSANGIGLNYDFDANPLTPIIEEGLRRSELRDAMIYVQLTRGVAPRTHAIPERITPTVVMTFKPRPILPEAVRQRGARVMTTRDIRWSNCSIKAIILLPNVLAKNEAAARRYDDAVFVTDDGEVREGTSSNIAIINGRQLTIPPRNHAILHGVTQGFLIDCATALGLSVEEKTFNIESLLAAEEVFLSSTAVELLGVTAVDDRPIGNGQVGPVTQRLHAEFLRRIRELGGN